MVNADRLLVSSTRVFPQERHSMYGVNVIVCIQGDLSTQETSPFCVKEKNTHTKAQ